jgi:preprotein translocase subunit SecG
MAKLLLLRMLCLVVQLLLLLPLLLQDERHDGLDASSNASLHLALRKI